MRILHVLLVTFLLLPVSDVSADVRVSLYDGLRQFRASVAPRPGADAMTLSASRNETVGLQAVLFNDTEKTLDKIDVVVADMPGVTVRVYAAAPIHVAVGPKTIEFPEDGYYDLLRPAGWETIEKKSFRPYWIDFAVAADAEPGTRKGTLTFKADGATKSVPVQLKVARPILPVSPTLPLAFAFVKGWIEQFYGRKLTEAELFQCYDMMLEHRLGPVPMWGGKKEFYVEKDVRHCAERGMNVFLVGVSGTSDEAVERSLGSVKPQIDLLKKFDAAGRTYQFAFDEILMFPGWEQRLPWMRKSYERFHDVYPAIKRIATARPDERLDDFTDIYVVPVSQFKADMSEKKAVWWYSVGNAQFNRSPDFRIDFPPLLQRYFFLAGWRAGVDGHLYWAVHREWPFNKEVKNKDRVEGEWVPSYSHASNGRRIDDCGAGNLFYPGGGKWASLPSVRAKYLREGVNDYEYLAQLRAATELLRKKKPAGWEKIAGEADGLMNFSPNLEDPPQAVHLDWKSQFDRATTLFFSAPGGHSGVHAWRSTKHGDGVSLTFHPSAVRGGSKVALRILPVEEETCVAQEIPVQKGRAHSATVHIKTDDLKGKAFLRAEYLDANGKTLQSADSEKHVSGSTGGKKFREVAATLPEAPADAALLRISLVAVLEPGYGENDKEPLCKAFFDDVSAKAGDRDLAVANPGFEEKYRFDEAQTGRYYAFRDRLVDCLDRACALLGETGPFPNARPGRDR